MGPVLAPQWMAQWICSCRTSTMRDGPPPRDAVSGASARARRTAMRYARRADASVVGRVWGRLLELEFIDRSVALAAKAFVSFFPLLIAFASVLPVQGRDEMLRVIATRLGVSGAAFGWSAKRSRPRTSPAQRRGLSGWWWAWPTPFRSPPLCSGSTCDRGGGRPAAACGTGAEACC